MMKLLVPVDGSATSLHAVEYAAHLVNRCQAAEIVLVNVQPPADSWELKSHLRSSEIEAMQTGRGGDVLASARDVLDAAKVPYRPIVKLGEVAESIVACAAEEGCQQIVMGNKGESFVEEMVTGSVAHEVLRLTPLPVTFVK
jgi:nucleotide-binding universal stress UspA family protein